MLKRLHDGDATASTGECYPDYPRIFCTTLIYRSNRNVIRIVQSPVNFWSPGYLRLGFRLRVIIPEL